MKTSRQQIRAKVDAELVRLGIDPKGVSNANACRLLGLWQGSLAGKSSSKLLRKWAVGNEPSPWQEMAKQIIAEYKHDQAKPQEVKRSERKARKSHRDRAIPKHREPGRVTHLDYVSVMGDAFLQTYEWRRLRMEAIKKYGRKCQCCGATPETGAIINVDHIKPRKIFPELALSLDNLQVLCHECNHGKGNWDMTDWRARVRITE